MAGPFFIPDVSSWQGPSPSFEAIAALPNSVGVILKSSQGVGPGVAKGHSMTWFRDNRARARAAGAGHDLWLLGSYHFATPRSSGATQADYVLKTLNESGGWSPDQDLAPAWDLEGEEWQSAQQVIDTSSQFAERIKSALGKAPILYTGVVWRKFGLRTRLGFETLWTTHMDLMTPFGWPNSSIILHQYGNGKYYNPRAIPAQRGYPVSIPGFTGDIDMNVVMDGGQAATSIDAVRRVLTGSSGAGNWIDRFLPSITPAPNATRGGVNVPLVIGAVGGAIALGLIIASIGNEELT